MLFVDKLKNQKSVVNFEQEGCIFYLYGEQKPLGELSPNFWVVGVHNVVTRAHSFPRQILLNSAI